MTALPDRFLSKFVVNPTNGCWEWTARCSHNGYPQYCLDGKRPYAHRVAYEMLIGPIPTGLQLDHLCRIRHCVNPAHLEPVTPRENLFRSSNPIAQQMRRTHCVNGHEFAGRNLHILPNGRRYCRACGALRARLRVARERLNAEAAR